MRKVIKLVLSVVLIGSSCSGFVPPPKLIKDYYKIKQYNEQVAQFDKYSLHDQFVLYRYAFRYDHPWPAHMPYAIAKRGRSIIPFLQEILESGEDEYGVILVAYVCRRMASNEDTPLPEKFINQLYQRVSAIRLNERWVMKTFDQCAPLSWVPPKCWLNEPSSDL